MCAGCHPLSPADAYRRSLCCACRNQPYSAGRPRCTDCHEDYLTDLKNGVNPLDLNRPPATPPPLITAA